MKYLLLLFVTMGGSFLASAQSKAKHTTAQTIQHQLVGSWSLVSVDNVSPDSSRVHPYGENPQGLMILDAKGNYAIQILKAVRPKVASGNKDLATAEENAELVKGNNSHYGIYKVNEAEQTITFKVLHAFFPNWENTNRIVTYTLKEGILQYRGIPTQGGPAVVAEVVWKKIP